MEKEDKDKHPKKLVSSLSEYAANIDLSTILQMNWDAPKSYLNDSVDTGNFGANTPQIPPMLTGSLTTQDGRPLTGSISSFPSIMLPPLGDPKVLTASSSMPARIQTIDKTAPQPFEATPEVATLPNGISLRLSEQPDPCAILVKKQVVDYVLDITNLPSDKVAQSFKVTTECWFWVDTTQKWELKTDAGDVHQTRQFDQGTLRITVQMKYQKTSKMLPVYMRFIAATPVFQPALSVDSAKVVLIGREDLQKTRAEGVLFWLRIAGSMENDAFKGKYPWPKVESMLKAHFAKEMQYDGRMFDEREMAFIRDRAKLGINAEQISRDTFLQTLWPWFYPVEQNIKKYAELWNNGLIHGFYQTNEVEQLIKDTPAGTFVLRFCSNSQFEPQGALAVTVSKGDYQVQHILLTAEALEKESLYKLLAKYTDCIYFYPNIPKVNIDKIRKEMDEVPGVAHYKDVGFATSSPGIPPTADLATTSAAAAAALGMAQFGNANAIFTTAAGNPLKRAGDSSTDEANAKRAAIENVNVIYGGNSSKVHLAEGLTFRQLIPTALKLFKITDNQSNYSFQDKEGVAYPDDVSIQSTLSGPHAEILLVKLL